MERLKKLCSFMGEVLKSRLLKRRIPILVTLCVTARCNFSCEYCYCTPPNREFAAWELLDLIDQLAGMGTKYISLNGGEALLRKDLYMIMNQIKLSEIICHLSTNGSLVEENLKLIKRVDSLSISIDGDRVNNDLNRGVGTYDKTIRAFELLDKNNIRFHTHTVLTKNNVNAMREVLSLALEYGFKAQFSPLRIMNSKIKDINLSDAELKEVIKLIIDFKKKSLPVYFSLDSYNNMLKWPFPYEWQYISGDIPEGYNPIKCYVKDLSCHIEPDGFVYPCIVLVGKYDALNFLEVGFEKAWENLSHNECKGCYNICCSEQNMVFGLKPSVLWNEFWNRR